MIAYEWTIEEIDEHGDIVDNDFRDDYASAASVAASMRLSGTKVEIGLVRNSINDRDENIEDRQWAYLKDGKLPDRFQTSGGRDGAKVPKKYFNQVTWGR